MKKMLLLLAAAASLAGAAEIKLSPHQVITRAWGGTMTKTPEAVEIKTTQIGKIYLARVRRRLPDRLDLWGKTFTYTFRACGKGKINVSFYSVTSLYKEQFSAFSKGIKLTDDWQECKVALRTLNPDIHSAYLVVELGGEGSFLRIADEKLEVPGPDVSPISAAPEFVMLPEKGGAKITFSAPGREQLSAFDGKKQLALTGKDGVFTLETPADIAPLGKSIPGSVQEAVAKTGVWDEKSGTAKSVYVSRLSELEWSRFSGIASGIHLRGKLNALFLGDSLSDFCRGFNFIDEINFWINKTNPGLFSCRNAGVAGFTFKQLHAGLVRPPADASSPLNDLWDRKYDLIFIFLGHNDTVQYFDKAWKPIPDRQVETLETYLPKVLTEIRKHSDARIILVSPASMDQENCRKFAEQRKRPGQSYYLFGMPENLIPWCGTLKKLAEKHGANFVDLYTPSLALPEKGRVFTPIDGVHLMPRGQHFVAETLLRHLAAMPL